jgi:hypothetical protein
MFQLDIFVPWPGKLWVRRKMQQFMSASSARVRLGFHSSWLG